MVCFLFTLTFFLVAFNNVPAKATTSTTEEFEVEFDINEKGIQEATFEKENGEEVIISLEPVEENMMKAAPGYLLPFGTSTYKVKASTVYIGMNFMVKVDVPKSNVNNSKFTSAYGENQWVIGGYLSDEKLIRSNKEAKFAANVIWLGGFGGSNVWLKATLSGNKLITTARM